MNTRILTQTFVIALAMMITLTIGSSMAFGQNKADKQSTNPVRYTVTDLGTLPGGTASYAFDLNNAGWVAGSSTLTPEGVNQHAVLWYGGQLTDLGTLGGPNSEADGPNASLESAIISETSLTDPFGEDFCGFGDHLQCLAAVWRPYHRNPLSGMLTALLPLPGGNNSQAYGINNRGQVVGFAENHTPDPTCITPFQVRRFEAVIWDRSDKIHQLQPLRVEGDTVGFAFGINDNGQAVGASGKCSDTSLPPIAPAAPHAVLWERDGSPRNLGNLGGTVNNIASSINNQSDVVGGSSSTDGNIHAFLWTRRTGMQDLGTLPGDFLSVAPCCDTINDRREVVGFSIGDMGPRAFLWRNGVMTDLNDIAPGSPLYLLFASAINSRGQIAGIGATSTGEIHAFLATPRDAADSENFSPVVSDDANESRQVILSENVRKLLEQKLRFGRIGVLRIGQQ